MGWIILTDLIEKYGKSWRPINGDPDRLIEVVEKKEEKKETYPLDPMTHSTVLIEAQGFWIKDKVADQIEKEFNVLFKKWEEEFKMTWHSDNVRI